MLGTVFVIVAIVTRRKQGFVTLEASVKDQRGLLISIRAETSGEKKRY